MLFVLLWLWHAANKCNIWTPCTIGHFCGHCWLLFSLSKLFTSRFAFDWFTLHTSPTSMARFTQWEIAWYIPNCCNLYDFSSATVVMKLLCCRYAGILSSVQRKSCCWCPAPSATVGVQPSTSSLARSQTCSSWRAQSRGTVRRRRRHGGKHHRRHPQSPRDGAADWLRGSLTRVEWTFSSSSLLVCWSRMIIYAKIVQMDLLQLQIVFFDLYEHSIQTLFFWLWLWFFIFSTKYLIDL